MAGDQGTSDEATAVDVIELSPFDIHFSQEHIRSTFQDGRLLEDTKEEIECVPRSSCSRDAADDGSEASVEEVIFLKVPFPRIEVIKWRLKLRNADGTAKVDASGAQMYSETDRWFTFDNRRLCVLQRAAAALWPKRAVCEVLDIPMTLARTRELRKFDTRTGAHTVAVGKRDEPAEETWCWRTAVGLPSESQPEAGVARQTMRWRGGNRQAQNGRGTNKGRRPRKDEDTEEGRSEFLRNLGLFLLVYLGLRFTMWAVRKETWVSPGNLLASFISNVFLNSNATTV